MEFSRSLSSKRSSAAIELCPSGLTERQMLQLALEESKNAALAAQAAAGKSEDSSDEEMDSDSDSDDGSSMRGAKAGQAKARRMSSKQKPRSQKSSEQKYACSTPRKRAKVESVEIRTATSSENSKASRSTQLRDLIGCAFGEHQVQVQPVSVAADNRESEISEHQSGSGDQHSMCQQGAHESASPSVKVEATEGAGETETSPRESLMKNEHTSLALGKLPGKEESAAHGSKCVVEDSKPPTGLKVKKKLGGIGKRTGPGAQRPPALTIPGRADRDGDAGSAEPEASKKARGQGSRGPRSANRNACPKGSRWNGPLNSPVGTSGRRLRSAVVEEMKHNIEGIEAFAWQPQTPARQRASSLSGACALLSKLSRESSGSLVREGSQALTPSLSAGQLSDVSTPRESPQPGTPKWLSPISEIGSSPLGQQPSLTGELPCALQTAASAELAFRLDVPQAPASPAATPASQADRHDFVTPRRPTATLEFLVSAKDPATTPTLLLPPAAPTFSGSCLPLKKLHSGKVHLSLKSAQSDPGALLVDACTMARQASADLKARHDLETKRLEMSAGAISDGGASSKPSANVPAMAATHSGRLGKALRAMQLGAPAPTASFQASCGRLLKPFECAKDAPAWKAPQLLRSSLSGGSLSISPHLARQREQRNLQNTWDDLLARQALEASAAEHLAEWAKASSPAQPAAQA